MRCLCKMFRCLQISIAIIAGFILLDMLVLGGKIKLWFIAVANTTSSSPFSTDGQSNWMLLLIMLNVGCVAGLCYHVFSGRKIKDKHLYLLIVLLILSIIMLVVLPGIIIN